MTTETATVEQPTEPNPSIVTATDRSPLLDERNWLGFAAMQHGRDGDGVLKLNHWDLLDEATQWMEFRKDVVLVHREVEGDTIRFRLTNDEQWDEHPLFCGFVVISYDGPVDKTKWTDAQDALDGYAEWCNAQPDCVDSWRHVPTPEEQAAAGEQRNGRHWLFRG